MPEMQTRLGLQGRLQILYHLSPVQEKRKEPILEGRGEAEMTQQSLQKHPQNIDVLIQQYLTGKLTQAEKDYMLDVFVAAHQRFKIIMHQIKTGELVMVK